MSECVYGCAAQQQVATRLGVSLRSRATTARQQGGKTEAISQTVRKEERSEGQAAAAAAAAAAGLVAEQQQMSGVMVGPLAGGKTQ